MRCLITAVLIIMLPAFLSATLYTVCQEGSGDYTTIMEAVQVTLDGDTILVYPGTYYENVSIMWNISLISKAITTGDEQYIEQTIIDGNLSGSVIMVYQSEDVYLGGFTITGGTGQHAPGTLETLQGGGINIAHSEVVIENCIITDNSAEDGGGIRISPYSSVVLKGNVIKENSAVYGGGIMFGGSEPEYVNVVFDAENKNSIYLNSASRGTDICGWIGFDPELDIILDVATVDELDIYYFLFAGSQGLVSYDNITLSVEETAIEPVEADLYVASWGSDDNSGLTIDEPLKRIAYALLKVKADSLNPRTIHIEAGVYSRSDTGELMPLPLKSDVTLTGETTWTLDAEFRTSFAQSHSLYGNIIVKNVKLERGLMGLIYKPLAIGITPYRVILENIEINEVYCTTPEYHSYVFVVTNFHNPNDDADIIISNVKINENHYGSGAAFAPKANLYIDRLMIDDTRGFGFTHAIWGEDVYTAGSETVISNMSITNSIHLEPWPGAYIVSGIGISGPLPPSYLSPDSMLIRFINCTIADNTSLDGVIRVKGNTNLEVYNTIICGNDPNTVILDGRYAAGNIKFSHTLLDNGLGDFLLVGDQYQFTYDTILSGDPLFLGEGEHPYQLSSGSPAIDTGTMDIDGYEFPPFDLAGNPRIAGESVDIGAYEYQPTSAENVFPDEKLQVLVYPNPINISKRGNDFFCTISFSLPTAGKLKVDIYNIKGQKVRRLLDADTVVGEYNIRWDGLNDRGVRVSSGIYFFRVTTPKNETVERVVMIK